MCRELLKFITGCAIVLVGVPVLIASVVFLTLSSPDYYKGNIEESGLYDRVPHIALISTEELFVGAEFEEGNADIAESEEFAEVWDNISLAVSQMVPQVITPGLAREVIEMNLDNFSSYLQGVDAELLIFIPKQEVRGLIEQFGVLVDDAIDDGVISSIPVCTENQLAVILSEGGAGTIECLSPSFQDLMADPEQVQAFAGSAQGLSDAILEQVPVLQGEETEPLLNVVDQLSQSGEIRENIEQPLQALNQAREYYSVAQFVLFLMWAAILSLVLLFFQLSTDPVVLRVRSLMMIFFRVGVIVVLIAAALLVGYTQYLQPSLVSILGTFPYFRAEIESLITLFVQGLLNNIVIIGALVTGVTLFSWVWLRYFTDQEKVSKDDKISALAG